MADYKSFTDSDLQDMGKIITDFEGDPAGTMLLRAHAFIDMRLDCLVQDFNEQDPKLQWARHQINSIDNCVYFSTEKGFNIPTTLNFTAKVDVFDSVKLFPKGVSGTLRRMNKVRNKYAHDFEYNMTNKDVTFAFEPMLKHNKGMRELLAGRPDESRNNVTANFSAHLMSLLGYVLLFPELAHIYKKSFSPIYDLLKDLRRLGVNLPDIILCEDYKLDDMPCDGLNVAIKYLSESELKQAVDWSQDGIPCLDFSAVTTELDKVILYLDGGDFKALVRGDIPETFYSDVQQAREIRYSDMTLFSICSLSWTEFSGFEESHDFGIIEGRNL